MDKTAIAIVGIWFRHKTVISGLKMNHCKVPTYHRERNVNIVETRSFLSPYPRIQSKRNNNNANERENDAYGQHRFSPVLRVLIIGSRPLRNDLQGRMETSRHFRRRGRMRSEGTMQKETLGYPFSFYPRQVCSDHLGRHLLKNSFEPEKLFADSYLAPHGELAFEQSRS